MADTKDKYKYWVVFELPSKYEVVSEKDSIQFKDDWSDLIMGFKKFSSYESALNYAKTQDAQRDIQYHRKSFDIMTPLERYEAMTEALNEGCYKVISELLKYERPGSKKNTMFKINESTHCCVAVFQCLDETNPQLNINPANILAPVKAFPKLQPENPISQDLIKDRTIHKCLDNAQFTIVEKELPWEKENNYVLMTSFPLPSSAVDLDSMVSRSDPYVLPPPATQERSGWAICQ